MSKMQMHNLSYRVNRTDWISEMTGHFLREQRRYSNLTGKELAKKMKLSQQQISRYERGVTAVNLPTLIHFFSVLNLEEREMLSFFELLVSQYQEEKENTATTSPSVSSKRI